MTEVHITAHDIVTSLQVCVQLKQLKMSQVELQQQLSTLNKQCLLLQEDNEKLLSIVDEQAKYELSDCVCVCVFGGLVCEQAVCVMNLVMCMYLLVVI